MSSLSLNVISEYCTQSKKRIRFIVYLIIIRSVNTEFSTILIITTMKINDGYFCESRLCLNKSII